MIQISQQNFTRSDGLNLVGDVGGAPGGPTVVLLHGGGQTRHSWHNAMTRLIEQGYHVVNYDARGHGDSDWSPKGDYAIRSLAADLLCVLKTITGPVVLVGASMGGFTSFHAVGSSDSAIARGLVLVDIVLRPAPEGVKHIKSFMSGHLNGFATLEEAADAVAAYNPDRPRPADISGLQKNLRLRDNGRWYWHWDPRLIDRPESPEPPQPISPDEVITISRGVHVPTLLIRGGRSDMVDDAGVAQMRELIPQTEVYDVAGAGHMVAGDRNDAFNEGVMSFLKRHLPAR